MTKKWIVSGRVQGVGFRAYTQAQAKRMGIVGTVKNLPNGNVEVLAVSDNEATLLSFKEKLKTGPLFSQVQAVVEEKVEAEEAFSDFDVII